jgi:hypothetical protein
VHLPEIAMPLPNTHSQEKLDERLEARATTPEDKLPTYQELLDDASDGSFPASDPPATTAATKTSQAVRTSVDDKDWKLQPEGCSSTGSAREVVAEFDDETAARHAQQRALQEDLPGARLDLPPADHPLDVPAATVTLVATDDEQVDKASEIVRGSGAGHVEVRPSA